MAKESDPEMWDYPAHTKAKHDILDDYLGGWYAKLSAYPRILFFDGFAGRGIYNDGTHGSPLIALKKLLDHSALARMSSCEFIFMFVEKDPSNAELLRSALDDLKAGYDPFPTNIKVYVVEGEFAETAGQISAELAAQRKRQAPTFAFIDPFGYSGLSMDVIADFVQFGGSEVFVNFMVGHVQRFVLRDGQEAAIRDLFGMSPSQVMENFDNDQKRVEYLRDVYVTKLKDRAKFPYVNSFEMKNASGNVSYYLIHGTRHPEGVRLMKAAMWKVDPGAGSTFSDRLAGREVLFELAPDLSPLREAILEAFAGETRVAVSAIRSFAVLQTPYRETHVIPVLTPLEKSGAITVLRAGARGYNPDTTWVDFP
jgi:three-Cys-motif partner protein